MNSASSEHTPPNTSASEHSPADASTGYAISRADVLAAHARISSLVHRTPLLTCSSLSTLASSTSGYPQHLGLKCELFQRSGSFKFRGAANAVLSLTASEASLGVCTHSSGNHAQALALAASLRPGCPAYIVMPSSAPAVKRAATAGYGAAITECAPTQAAREGAAAALAAATGAAFVHPSEDPRVMAGQGTLALEMLEQAREALGGALDACLIPIGGGGLISGVALALAGSGCLLVGAEPAAAADAARSKAQGRLLGHEGSAPPATCADGLRTTLGPHTWPIVRDCVAHIVCVSEEEIRAALLLVYQRAKLACEPSAAVAVAAAMTAEFGQLLRGRLGELGRPARVGVLLCGGNAEVEKLFAV